MATDTNSPRTTAASPRSAASIRGQKAAATRKRNAAVKAAQETRTAARATATTAKTNAKATRTSARRTATEAEQTVDATAAAVEAEAKVRVNQVQQLAEKVVLVQVGAGLTVRDNVVSTVKDIAEYLGVAVPDVIKKLMSLGEMATLAAGGDEALLDRCATILRLAEHLERGRDQSVSEVRLDTNGDGVDLHLKADGDLTLPRWSVERYGDGEVFERVFGRRLLIG